MAHFDYSKDGIDTYGVLKTNTVNDLYDHIVELETIVRTLTYDIKRFRRKLGARSIAAARSKAEESNRRVYVRAIFSLIEAIIERHKLILLRLSMDGKATMTPKIRMVLEERGLTTGVVKTARFLGLKKKLATVYEEGGKALGQTLNVDFGKQGGKDFLEAIKIRDRLTHPKSYEDCLVDDTSLETVELGEAWFRGLNNEFVKVAMQHRTKAKW